MRLAIPIATSTSLIGSNYDDVLIGDGNDNFLRGRAGADTLIGGGGSDTADYAFGPAVRADLSDLSTNTGWAFGDTYDAIANLRGSGFGDILKGDAGDNILTGLSGADTFIYSGGHDTITDFSQTDGDQIDLTGSGISDWATLQALFSQNGADTLITFGTGNTLTLTGVTATNLAAADFIFQATATLNVVTPNGFAFYYTGDIANADPTIAGTVHTATLSQAINYGTGHSYNFIGTGFTYDASNNFTGGQISEIDFYDPSSNALLATLVFGNGTIDAAALSSAIADFHVDINNAGEVSALFGAFSWVEHGGTGNDVLPSYIGADSFGGGGGSDFVSYLHSPGPVTVNLTDPSQNTGAAAGDTYSGITNVIGSNSSDTLIGDGSVNALEGGAGADALDGGGSSAGYGPRDYASYIFAPATDLGAGIGILASLDLTNPFGAPTGDAAGDTYVDIYSLIGSNYDDILVGDANDNFLRGRGGADALHGGGGSDTADYNFGPAVRADLSDPSTNTGWAFGDTYDSIENLRGSGFGDTLKGNAGDNILTGLSGADTFIYSGGNDTVTDFNPGEGDKIDLTGSAATDWAYLQSVMTQSGADTFIDLGSGNTLTLTGVTAANLTSADFFFSTSPVISGDLTVRVLQGGAVQLNGSPQSDVFGLDPDTPANQLNYSVDAAANGHVVVSNDPSSALTDPTAFSFTQQDLNDGRVYFVSDGAAPIGPTGLFTVTLTDGVGPVVTATVTAFISSAQFNVLADPNVISASGYNFDADDPITKMGLGITQMGGEAAVGAGATSTAISIQYDGGSAADDRVFEFVGVFTGLTGFITSITEKDGNGHALAEFLFAPNTLAAEDWLSAVEHASLGDYSLVDALTATWNFNFASGLGNDAFSANGQQDLVYRQHWKRYV